MLVQTISKNSLVLTLFALVTAALLAGTYQLTKDSIANSEREAAAKALYEVVPKSRLDNDLLQDTQPLPEEALGLLGLKQPQAVHIARKSGDPVAVIIPARAPDGYSGGISMIVGVNIDGSIAGVRVLSHNETPGLGDKVDMRKSDWVLTFDGKSLANPAPELWAVKKDGGQFDQFTGATITPRAVVAQVQRVLEFYQLYAATLLAADQPATEGTTHE